MRLILDTNVLVSANIQRGYPNFIVARVFADPNLELCFSAELFTEYVDVLNREKFAKFPDFHSRVQTMLSDIQTFGIQFTPTTKVDLIRDEPDNRLLELADTCKAQYLVTGNTNDFTMTEYKGTKIVSQAGASVSLVRLIISFFFLSKFLLQNFLNSFSQRRGGFAGHSSKILQGFLNKMECFLIFFKLSV